MTTTPSGHTGPRRWLARLTLVVLTLCVLTLAPLHWNGGLTSTGVILAAATPAMVGTALLATLLGLRHRTPLRLTLMAALLVGLSPLLDHVVADPGGPATGSVTLRVTGLNAAWSAPSDDEIRELAAGSDVLVLQEWDPAQVDATTELLGAGWSLASASFDDYIGATNAVWVRDAWRVVESRPMADAYPPAEVHLIERDGAQVRVVGTRLENPAFRAAHLWGRGLDALAAEAKGGEAPVVVLGDLNAPPSAVAFRDFRREGRLADCTAQLGSGFPGTWGPGSGPRYAPVPIDHVLVGGPEGRRARCTAFTTIPVSGTDHRAVRAEVAVPPVSPARRP